MAVRQGALISKPRTARTALCGYWYCGKAVFDGEDFLYTRADRKKGKAV